jgi:hypothetical protein
MMQDPIEARSDARNFAVMTSSRLGRAIIRPGAPFAHAIGRGGARKARPRVAHSQPFRITAV